MRRNRRLPTSEAEKVADKIAKLINDLTLDLDQVGFYVARNNLVTYNRLIEIAEAAEYEREIINGRQQDTLF
jgi:hypothetical protein